MIIYPQLIFACTSQFQLYQHSFEDSAQKLHIFHTLLQYSCITIKSNLPRN